MHDSGRALLPRVFARVLAWRWAIVAFYALLLPPAAYFASHVGQDNSVDRLIVATDPDYIATREFEKVFGGGEFAIILVEADDPYARAVLERFDRLEQAMARIPGVEPNSALSTFRRAKAGFEATPEQSDAFRRFATGTDLFRRQGLIGDDFLAIAFVLDVPDSTQRLAAIAAIDRAIATIDTAPSPFRSLDRLGEPYVNAYLDEIEARTAPLYFGLFAVFVIILNLTLYRSVRTLIAFLVTRSEEHTSELQSRRKQA
jgi:uncharacterized protein